MSAIQGHIRFPQSVRRIIAQRRFWRVAAILLVVLLAQVAPISSRLPLGLSGPAAVHAATAWYVDRNNSSASDSNACTSLSSPCLTIGGTLGKAGSGDTINISPGVYTENLTIASNLTLVGAGARSTFIDGSNSGAVITVNSGGALNISGVTLQHGKNSIGGGIASNGTLNVTNTTIANNNAAGPANAVSAYGGGGIAIQGGTATIRNSTIENNTTNDFGAGIDIFAGTTTVVNSTIAHNTASAGGVGIITWSGAALSLSSSTIAENSGSGVGGSGIYNYGAVAIVNTIVAGNPGGDCRNDTTSGGGTMTDGGYNLNGDTTCGFTAVGSMNNTDPQFATVAPTNNGGQTDTIAVQASSPAIDKIPASACIDDHGARLTTDQRGVSHPVSACTIGAFEADQANDTWATALTLNQTSGSYQVNQTVSQRIYAPNQERWYKFLVTPGSNVHLQYSGLPGAILSLHSDLQSEYGSLTNPTSAALESAKGAASGFLPSSFLPSSFLPSSFLPSSFLPGPYSGAAYASLLAVSATPHSSVQTIDHDTWNSFGYFYVRVVGPANASAPFSLTITESSGICAGVATTPFTPPAASSLPTGLKTLILWDPSRIAGSASDISALGTKLGLFASRSEVQSAVIDLSQIPGIDGSGSAQQQADNNPACPTAKNLVADDIKSVIQAYRAQNPGLQYIVLAGDDRSIPFFRYPDESGLGSENQYYPPVADSTASNASLRDNFVLGQDEYGASLDLPLSDVSLPIPDLAVGRLVKTAAEVSHMLDVYTAANGLITPASSLVTGYDFVADAATNAQAELQAGTNATPDTLISPQGQSPSASWTANDLRQKLFGRRHDVVFLAGHFSAGNLEAADYATTVGAAEVASSTVDMSNTLILALGCHGGYNIPGGDAVANVSPVPDWPEALAEKGATLLATTGYAYGDTVLTEYGEHLFDNYVRQLRSYSGASYVPVTAGQADVAAKKEYLVTHTNLTGVDEKTLLETTLYGLPMLQVNMTGQHIGAQPDTSIVGSAPTVSSGPGQQFGLAVGQTGGGSSDIDVQPTLTSHTVSLTNNVTNASVTATYLTGPNNGEVARPAEPIFPSQLFNAHVPNQILRGVAFRGGTYTDTPHVTPLTSAAATEISVGHPAFFSNVLYPTQVWTANYVDAINGGPERLVTTPAQYISTSPGSTDGTLRQFSDLKFRLFYLPSNWTTTPISQAATAAAPTIAGVAATADSSGNVTFSAHVLSGQSAGTQGVWITYTDPNNPGAWQSIDLSQDGTDPTLWTATQSLPSSIVFMAQAVNGTGLVTLDTNSGAYYTVGSATQPAVTVPTTVTVQSAPSTGVYQTTSGQFQVQVQGAGSGGSTALSGQLVTLQLGSQQAFGATDANGAARITLPLNQPPGPYTVVATFAGATAPGVTYQASSSAPGTFTITPAPTTLSLAPSSATASYGGATEVTATLTTAPGAGQPQGLLQKTVFFTVSGNGLTYQKSVITDYQGRAQLPALPLPAGTYTVNASFAQPVALASGATLTLGDDNYQPSSTQSALTIQLFTPGSLLVLNQSGTNCHLLLNGGTSTAGAVSVDGTSSSALCINGGSLSAHSITVQGGVLKNGGTLNGTLSVHQPATPDLLVSLPAPTAPTAACPGAACPDGTNLNGGHSYRLLPGTYTRTLNVNRGATVCVAPGVYDLQANWNVNAALRPFGSAGCPALPGGTTDSGVLLYFQQGVLQLNSGGNLTQLSAPQTGPYAGLLYWQVSSATTAINGSAAISGGAWYEPAGTLILNGGAHLTAPMVAAASITINGGATLSVTSS